MESYNEEYYTQCGELYLTVRGNIVIHCTLCENLYKSFKEYANHTKIHYQDYTEEKIFGETETEASQSEYLGNNEETNQPAIETSIVKTEYEEAMTIETYNATQINPKHRYKALKACEKDRKHKCPYCDYACPDKSNIQSHIKRHSTEKQHKCIECSKAFHTRTELDIHSRTHTGEKPYLCTECGLSFTTSSKLSSHRKRHFKIRDKICKVCNFACFDGSSLRKHEVIHSDDRNYKCPQCLATFKARVALWNHMKIHANRKEYACKLCKSKFNQYAGLYSHMKSSHTISI